MAQPGVGQDVFLIGFFVIDKKETALRIGLSSDWLWALEHPIEITAAMVTIKELAKIVIDQDPTNLFIVNIPIPFFRNLSSAFQDARTL